MLYGVDGVELNHVGRDSRSVGAGFLGFLEGIESISECVAIQPIALLFRARDVGRSIWHSDETSYAGVHVPGFQLTRQRYVMHMLAGYPG